MSKLFVRLALGASLALTTATLPSAQVVDGSFESGGFGSWIAADCAGGPFAPLSVVPAGVSTGFGFFTSAPTDGGLSAFHGFDGSGPCTIELAQDIVVDKCTLSFDWQGAHDMTFGATLDRTFRVDIEPAGGGAPLSSTLIHTAVAGTTVLDTGPMTSTVDLSPFLGTTVRIHFIWDIPEPLVGPGQFTLDNVRTGSVPGSETPRFGVPPNAGVLTGSGPPVIGAPWFGTVSGVPSATDVLIADPTGSMVNVVLPFGTVLCAIPGPIFFFFGPPGAPIGVPIPADCTLVGLAVCAQGAGLTFGPLGINPTNALDLVVGG